MKIIRLLAVVGTVIFLVSCVGMETKTQDSAVSAKDYGSGYLYTCNCGAQCACNDVKAEPGNCSCGNPLKPGKVLEIDDDEATLCDCSGGCSCSLNSQNAGQCSCGKLIKQVNAKGLYVCNCGSGCTCNTVADKPGNCSCGAPLREVK